MLDYLIFWYQVMVASEPLLEDAIAGLKDDGWEGDLKAFYKKHLEDERNHAKWLREDIGDHSIGLSFIAAALAGTQYYLIRHVHPVALMGYMIALEGGYISPEIIARIEAELGPQASRTVRIHAEADPNHIQELLSVPIPDEYRDLVEASRQQTLQILGSLHGNR